jgi:signal transduction histidine kinase
MTASLKESLQRLAAHERSAALGELAAYAAHNIRNPLAGIRAAAQVLIGDNKTINKELSESLTEIIETIDRLDLWLKRLLEYARPLEPHIEHVDINRLVTESVNTASRTYSEKHPRLIWELSKNLPDLPVDSILMEQAFTAIAANAFEAINTNGLVSIKTELIERDGHSEHMEIIISDDGRGVSKEIQPKLFRAFMTSRDGGTGLGLAQAKKIVDLHGGEIGLESSPGRGTSVAIRLPVRNDFGMKQDRQGR